MCSVLKPVKIAWVRRVEKRIAGRRVKNPKVEKEEPDTGVPTVLQQQRSAECWKGARKKKKKKKKDWKD
jgi:hypothetical protein